VTAYTASVVAFLITVALLLVLRPLASSIGLVDHPGGRKIHKGEVPVIGGIAMFGGLVVAAVMGGELGHNGIVVILSAAFMILIGALDDRFDLAPQFRLFAHAAAAIALTYGTGFAVLDLGDLLGFGPIATGWLTLPFTVIACMALINAFNMLDGLDGLAGGCALVAMGGLSVIAIASQAPSSAIIACSLLGACFGFLLFNLPAQYNRSFRTFMGDSGSTLLGFVLACVALALIQPSRSDIPPVFILWMLPIPIFELFTSTSRRLIRGRSPLRADQGHFHHQLLQAGFSVRLIFAIYLALSFAAAACGIAALWAGLPEPMMFVLFLLLFVAWLGFMRIAPWIGVALPKQLRRDVGNLAH
jgi:UDP-GlcNAc:undecaprenyl-phosphate GlcNAc-1-phosphate transferase